MNVISCRMCRKPFQSIGGRLCHDCLEQIDKDFITVRDYIYDHKGTDIDEASRETGVERAIIMHLLREGRLVLGSSDSEGHLECEVCKKPINTGRMCKSCQANVASTMQQNVEARKPPDSETKSASSASLKGTAKLER